MTFVILGKSRQHRPVFAETIFSLSKEVSLCWQSTYISGFSPGGYSFSSWCFPGVYPAGR